MLKIQLVIFLQSLSNGLVKDEHIDHIHKIMRMLSQDTKDKFIAYDLYKDLLLKEKEDAETQNKA